MAKVYKAIINGSLGALIMIIGLSLVPVHSQIFAASTESSHLSKHELIELALELAPKVNLFKAVWDQDPDAVFFAGTTRDFLYWIVGEFKGLETPSQIEKKKSELRNLPIIDIQEMISTESDCDVLSDKSNLKINPETYGLKKFDLISKERLDPKSELGQTEIQQGYIPTEKILLSQTSLSTPPQFGDGINEILTGDLTVHFADEESFWKTYYAKEGLNHPALLALRFIRLLAQDYFNRYGSEEPDQLKLYQEHLVLTDKIRKIFKSASTDSRFKKFLANERSQKFLNGSLLKSFRSRTNPRAALLLLQHFEFDQLQALFPKEIEPLNQFLFKKNKDRLAIEGNLRQLGLRPGEISMKVSDYFPTGKFVHGTRTPAAFRSILIQGILPSKNGSIGAGLYGVAVENETIAIDHAGTKDFIVEFEVSPDAVVFDINSDQASRVINLWKKHKKIKDSSNDWMTPSELDEFCEFLGIDILAGDYNGPKKAFAVKNSSVLSKPRGKYTQIRTLKELSSILSDIKSIDDLIDKTRIILESELTSAEKDYLFSSIDPSIFQQANLSDINRLPIGKFAIVSLFRDSFPPTIQHAINERHKNEMADNMRLALHTGWNRDISASKADQLQHIVRTYDDVYIFLRRAPADMVTEVIKEHIRLPSSSMDMMVERNWIVRHVFDSPRADEFAPSILEMARNSSFPILIALWGPISASTKLRTNRDVIEKLTDEMLSRNPEYNDFQLERHGRSDMIEAIRLSPRLKKFIREAKIAQLKFLPQKEQDFQYDRYIMEALDIKSSDIRPMSLCQRILRKLRFRAL